MKIQRNNTPERMKKERFFKLNNYLKKQLKIGVENRVFSGAAAGIFLNTEKKEKSLVRVVRSLQKHKRNKRHCTI